MADKGIPSWPKVTIRLYDAHNGEVKIAGRSHPVVDQDPRQAALALVADRAAQLGRPVKATAVEPDGTSWPLVIHPDGSVDSIAPEVGRGRGRGGKAVWPVYLAIGVALVLLAGTLTYLLVIRDRGPKEPQAVSTTLPPLPEPSIKPDIFQARPVPTGWTSSAAWTVDLMPNTTPAVSPDGKQVALITNDAKVAVLDANGKVLWQDKVNKSSKSPVFTTIDGNPVVAVVSDDYFSYWPREGATGTFIKLPSTTQVQFYGSSPLVVNKQGTFVVSGESLRPIDAAQIPREASVLLAEGQQVLVSRYYGPWWLLEPDKPPVEVKPKAPPGSNGQVERVVLASAGRVLVLWKTKGENVVPVVHNTKTGAPAAICQPTTASNAASAKWIPDPEGKVAGWGTCVISVTTNKIYTVAGLEPLSAAGGKIYGRLNTNGTIVTPGQNPKPTELNMARPWGIAGNKAIVLHENVIYALTPA
ncbi:hypothetical protein [Kribbella deserti]|uniref:Uncharacterized protein n=1 Tax=Kribbella deserti TaxID=1926257 RepID=A0ABV6QMT6_9ACTN